MYSLKTPALLTFWLKRRSRASKLSPSSWLTCKKYHPSFLAQTRLFLIAVWLLAIITRPAENWNSLSRYKRHFRFNSTIGANNRVALAFNLVVTAVVIAVAKIVIVGITVKAAVPVTPLVSIAVIGVIITALVAIIAIAVAGVAVAVIAAPHITLVVIGAGVPLAVVIAARIALVVVAALLTAWAGITKAPITAVVTVIPALPTIIAIVIALPGVAVTTVIITIVVALAAIIRVVITTIPV